MQEEYVEDFASDSAEDLEAFYDNDKNIKRAKSKEKGTLGTTAKKTYKLGEEIANGVRFFGQEKWTLNSSGKGGYTSAMCICPKCGELWRVSLMNVRKGNSTSCCGQKGKEGYGKK